MTIVCEKTNNHASYRGFGIVAFSGIEGATGEYKCEFSQKDLRGDIKILNLGVCDIEE